MSLVKQNIVANIAGSGWNSLLSVVFVPLYIKFIGIEAFGLIGFFVTMQAVFSLMDMGLSTTLNREIARLSVYKEKAQEMRNLVRTLEVVYWIIAAVIGISVILLSSIIANKWINAGQLSPDTIQRAIIIMGLILTFQWSYDLYYGGLLGLQRQVLLNGIVITITTLRSVGAVFILWRISPTVDAFFIWQLAISMFQTFVMALIFWHSLPGSGMGARFQGNLFRGIWRFAAGISGINATALVLTQLDKIILSKLLTLEMFGYYVLANMVAISLFSPLVSAVYSAIFPKFTQLITLGDYEGLKKLYHSSSQFMSVLIIPLSILIVFFSQEILFIWTQNNTIVKNAFLVLSLLTVGRLLLSVGHVPTALLMAHGWTKLPFYTNLISVIILTPLIYFMSTHYGAVGAAIAWVVLNLGYFFIYIPILHHRFLPGEKWRWYSEDVGKPLIAAVLTAGIGRLFVSSAMSQLAIMISLVIIYIATLLMAILNASHIRVWCINFLKRKALYEI